MAGPLIGPQPRAVGLVLPLVAFIGLTFVAPLATMLSRSVYDPVVADALPETLGLLQDSDGVQPPLEPMFEAIARELRKAREERTLGRIAARVNRVRGGLRSVITRMARRLREAESSSWRDTLVGVHVAWDDVQTWHAIRQAG
jgi:putative spermidine/putrescine transport system permease protein